MKKNNTVLLAKLYIISIRGWYFISPSLFIGKIEVKKFIIILISGLFFSSFAYASVEAVTDFVNRASDKTLSIVGNKQMSDEEKVKELNRLFEDSMDVDWIAKFVMGRYWREATKSQKEEYIKVYKKFLINSYVPKFREYTDQKIEFKNVIKEQEGEYLVQTEIQKPGDPAIRIDYKIRQMGNGDFLIFDIIAEGISLITTQRSDFGSILSRKGVDYLIERLKAKVSAY